MTRAEAIIEQVTMIRVINLCTEERSANLVALAAGRIDLDTAAERDDAIEAIIDRCEANILALQGAAA